MAYCLQIAGLIVLPTIMLNRQTSSLGTSPASITPYCTYVWQNTTTTCDGIISLSTTMSKFDSQPEGWKLYKMSPQAVSACSVPILMKDILWMSTTAYLLILMRTPHADTACGDICIDCFHIWIGVVSLPAPISPRTYYCATANKRRNVWHTRLGLVLVHSVLFVASLPFSLVFLSSWTPSSLACKGANEDGDGGDGAAMLTLPQIAVRMVTASPSLHQVSTQCNTIVCW